MCNIFILNLLISLFVILATDCVYSKNINSKKKYVPAQKINPKIVIDPLGNKIFQRVASKELLATKLKNYVPKIQHHFVIVSTSYNNAQWYERNLGSVYAQDYENYSVVYVDDASPDGTGKLVAEYIEKKKQEHRTTLIVNEKNQGACSNWYNVVNNLPPEVIIVALDGDDWLSNKSVLSLLNKVYNKYNVLVTYGSFQMYPFHGLDKICEPLPYDIMKNNKFREYKWVTSHLRTFKAGLYQRIKKEDLFYDGTFLKMASDQAFMYPILEMAGMRSIFIPDILHVYNCATPLNEHKVNAEYQTMIAEYIHSKPKYQPLTQEINY